MSSFDEALNRPPAIAWKPNGYKPNPLVGGQIYRYTHDHPEYGEAEMLGILSESDQKVYGVLCATPVLRTFVEHEDPKNGDRVGIRYVGERQGKRGTYPDFNCAVDRTKTLVAQAPLTESPPAEPGQPSTSSEESDLDDSEELPF